MVIMQSMSDTVLRSSTMLRGAMIRGAMLRGVIHVEMSGKRERRDRKQDG